MRVSYVLEDQAHAQFVPPLFRRLAKEEGVELAESELAPMRGDGRTISGLRRLLVDIRTGSPTRPDLIVVGIDADCGPRGERERQIRRACELEDYEGDVIVAEPDPHIEIWYLADPVFLQQLLQTPSLSATPDIRCKKDEYKEELRSIAMSSGARAPLGGVEYGPRSRRG